MSYFSTSRLKKQTKKEGLEKMKSTPSINEIFTLTLKIIKQCFLNFKLPQFHFDGILPVYQWQAQQV